VAKTEDDARLERGLAFRQALGNRIRELRRKRGINQDDFAHLAGIHRTHVGMLENSKIDPKLSTLLNVAEALEIEVSELLAVDSG
jgi:transcriptional regulator with XRE-family HTH domain